MIREADVSTESLERNEHNVEHADVFGRSDRCAGERCDDPSANE
jgi:hypothetical protein